MKLWITGSELMDIHLFPCGDSRSWSGAAAHCSVAPLASFHVQDDARLGLQGEREPAAFQIADSTGLVTGDVLDEARWFSSVKLGAVRLFLVFLPRAGQRIHLASCTSIRNLIHLAFVSSQNLRILCPTALSKLKNSAGAEPSFHHQPNRGKSTPRNGAAARSYKLPDPGETAPLVGRSRTPRQRSQWCGAPKRDRRRHRSGELRAQSCEFSEKQTTFHFTSLPCHHFTAPLPRTQPS